MNSEISIRRVYKDDAAALASLHSQCFSEAWSKASFESLLENDTTFALVVIGNDTQEPHQAFIVTSIAADEAEILTLGTAPGLRRSGFARALVLAASTEAHARGATNIFLEVGSNNTAAEKLYTGIGFSIAGRRPRYYRDNYRAIDALIMRASLPLAH